MLDNKQKIVIALGYFDCVHKGHKQVIQRACSLANNLNAKPIVFTFKGNLRAKISGEQEKNVYLLSERVALIKKLGVEEVFVAPVTKTFLNTGKLAFLNKLNKQYNIVAYVCGQDYRFGKMGKGNVEYLKEYAKKNNQILEVLSDVLDNGEKISTTHVKKLLSSGNMKNVNAKLSFPYLIINSSGSCSFFSVGIPITLTSSPSLVNSSPIFNVAFCPGLSPSKDKYTLVESFFTKCICSEVIAVPIKAITFL